MCFIITLVPAGVDVVTVRHHYGGSCRRPGVLCARPLVAAPPAPAPPTHPTPPSRLRISAPHADAHPATALQLVPCPPSPLAAPPCGRDGARAPPAIGDARRRAGVLGGAAICHCTVAASLAAPACTLAPGGDVEAPCQRCNPFPAAGLAQRCAKWRPRVLHGPRGRNWWRLTLDH